MDDKRKGEIAYALLKLMLKRDGFEIDQNYRRRVGSFAKDAGVPFDEMLEFSNSITMEIFTEVSDKSKPPTDDELSGDWGHGH